MENNRQNVIVYGCLVSGKRALMLKSDSQEKHFLPNGIVEFGETAEEAIMRVFQEQTGLLIETIAPIRISSEVEENLHSIGIHYWVQLVDEDDDVVATPEGIESLWMTIEEISEERSGWNDEIRQTVEIAVDLYEGETNEQKWDELDD